MPSIRTHEELAMQEILDYAKRWHGVHGISPEWKIELVTALMYEFGIELQTRFVWSLKAMTYGDRVGPDEESGGNGE